MDKRKQTLFGMHKKAIL